MGLTDAAAHNPAPDWVASHVLQTIPVVRRHRGNQLVSPELGNAHPLGLNRQGQQTEVDLSADEPCQRGSAMPARDAQVDLRQGAA
jgi:hypothetical protein